MTQPSDVQSNPPLVGSLVYSGHALLFPLQLLELKVLQRPVEYAQYTSVAFGKRCKEMGVRPSMGTVGDAYDNAMAESFFATLECELIDRRVWITHTEAKLAIFT